MKVPSQQRGFLIPLAAFIIVVMGLMALVVSRTTTQTGLAGIQEQASLQAFYAAESGAQYSMNQLFYRTGSPVTRASATAACSGLDGSSVSFNTVGLRNCGARLQCRATVNTSGANARTYYAITSDGSCDLGDISATRTVDVMAQLAD